MRLSAVVAVFLALAVTPADAVNIVSLSPAEFAEDLQKASDHVERGRYAEAIALLEVLIADEPGDADALSLMAYSLRKTGDLDRAEQFYVRALEAQPEHAGANQYLGELFVERGDLDAARARLAVLDAVCGTECAGRDELAAAIAAASGS